MYLLTQVYGWGMKVFEGKWSRLRFPQKGIQKSVTKSPKISAGYEKEDPSSPRRQSGFIIPTVFCDLFGAGGRS